MSKVQTSKIWDKHFSNRITVGLSESENFFEELNQEIFDNGNLQTFWVPNRGRIHGM